MDRSQQWALSARQSIADQLLHGQQTSIPDGYTETDISLAHKYHVINLDDIISENATDPQWGARVLVALDILRRYGKNLLRPAENRPKEWRIIKYINPIYVEKVQPLKGSRIILHQLGYVLDCTDSFKYPENTEPDIKHVALVTAEILLALADLKEFLSGKHVRHDDICSLMPLELRPALQRPASANRPVSQPGQTSVAHHGGTPGQATTNIQWSTPGQGGTPAGGGAPPHRSTLVQHDPTPRNSLGQHEAQQRVTATQGDTATEGGTPMQHETPRSKPPQSSTHEQHVLHQIGSTSQGGTFTQGGTILPGGTPVQHGPIQRGITTQGGTILPGSTQGGIPPQGDILIQGGTPPHVPTQRGTPMQYQGKGRGTPRGETSSQGGFILPGGTPMQHGPIQTGITTQGSTTLPGGTQRVIPPQGGILTQGAIHPHVPRQGGTPMQYQPKGRGTSPQRDTFTQGGLAAPGGTAMQNESTWRDPPSQRSIHGQLGPTTTSSSVQEGTVTQVDTLQQGDTPSQGVTPRSLFINTSSDNGPPSTIHPLPPTPQPEAQADVNPMTSARVSSGAPYQQQPEFYSGHEINKSSSSSHMVSTSRPQWFQPHGPMNERKPTETQGSAQTQTFSQPFPEPPHILNQTTPPGGILAGQANYSETQSQSHGKPSYTVSQTYDFGNMAQRSGHIDTSEPYRTEVCNTQGNVQRSDSADYQVPPPRIINASSGRGHQVLQQFASSYFHGHGPMNLGNTRFLVSNPQEHAQRTPHQSQEVPVTMPDLSTPPPGYQEHGPVPQTYGHPAHMSSSGVQYSGPSRTQGMPYTGNEDLQASNPQRAPEMPAGRAEVPVANTHPTTSNQPNPFDVDDLVKITQELKINKTKYSGPSDNNYLCPSSATHEVKDYKTGSSNLPGMQQRQSADGQDLNLYDGDGVHVYETIDDVKRQTEQTENHGSGNKTYNKKEPVLETSTQSQKTAMSHDQETASTSSDGGVGQQHAKFKDRPLPPIECPHCRNINPAESAVCLKCEAGLLSDRNWPEMPPGQRQTAPNRENDVVTQSHGTHKVAGAVWKCERCRKDNPPDTRECTACNTFKDETVKIPKFSTQDNQMQVAPPCGESEMNAEPMEPGWTCEFCTSHNPYGKKICCVCGKTNDVPLSDPAKAKEQERTEDTLKEKICQKCFALNPQDGTACVSCKRDFSSSKPQWDCEYCTSKNPYGRRICAVCGKTNSVPLMDPNTQQHEKPVERDPDGWRCGHCTTENKASVRICSSCNRTKGTTPEVQSVQDFTRHELQGRIHERAYPEVVPDEGEIEGTERTCPTCSFVNLADADLCISCANKLTHENVEEPPSGATEIQAIKCNACGQLNRITAEVCRHCRQRLNDNNAICPDGFQRSDMHRAEPVGVKCGNCTYINPPNTRICTLCGKTIGLGAGTTQFDNQSAQQMRQTYGERKHETTRQCPNCDKQNHIEAEECIHCQKGMQKQRTQLLGNERDTLLQAAAVNHPVVEGERNIYQILSQLIGETFKDLLGQGAQNKKPDNDDHENTEEFQQTIQQKNKRPATPDTLPADNDDHENREEFQQTIEQKGGLDVDSLMTDRVPIGDHSLLQYQQAGIKAGFTLEEVKMALEKADGNDPIAWLKTVWRVKLKDVVEAVEERYFQYDPLGARVGQISASEIRRALLKTNGDVEEAVKECARARRAMVTEILEFCNFEEAKIHHLLFQKDGDVDATIHALSAEVLEPITKRLYGHQEGDTILDDQHVLFDSSFVESICNPDRSLESRARMAMVMGGMDSLWEAMDVVRLIDEIDMNQNVSVRNVIETRKRCDSYKTALDCLQKACEVCNRAFSIDLLWSISSCACMTCRECFVQQYSTMIRQNQAWKFSCPICGLPNLLENRTQTMNFFAELQNQLQHLLMKTDKQDLEGKILDFTLKGKEEFVWCSECERGLFVNDLGNDLKCTKCDQVPQDLKEQLKECPLCMDSFMMEKIQTLSHCQCHFCTECFTNQFKHVIETESPSRYTCPKCSEPDLNDDDVAAEYFSFLENKLKHLVTPKEHETLCTKIRDWSLRHDERFMWCSNPQCLSGFLYDGDNKATCPNCQMKTCPRCKEAWEDAHENRTCAEFHIYKEISSAKGALDVLRLNKMYCPECRAVFILERGGCQHLTCHQCGHQFCEGCLQPFGKCVKFDDCKLKGLHAHHPRYCSYYLRDERYGVDRLTRLLEENDVEFDKGDVVEDDDNEDVDDENNGCPVRIDNENPAKDEKHPCGNLVQENQAGLCTKHYKEYLIKEINRHRLDPVEIMDVAEMIMVIDREHMLRPAQNDRQTLVQFVKENLPIHQER